MTNTYKKKNEIFKSQIIFSSYQISSIVFKYIYICPSCLNQDPHLPIHCICLLMSINIFVVVL